VPCWTTISSWPNASSVQAVDIAAQPQFCDVPAADTVLGLLEPRLSQHAAAFRLPLHKFALSKEMVNRVDAYLGIGDSQSANGRQNLFPEEEVE
jgi:hypothetical protein